ncbi:uncharacterized protein [Fopius arisanus]|uniref:Uncharacterized protein isoform X3 n=1 Tax=Fopius arisanus TaxID=64838 RepID=A0A9R1TP59_9HYME|nr:PREDICTED: uncharacterized protein LOC105272109 isoform X3 [Fopius arisanus]
MTVKIIPVSLGEEVKLHLLSFIFGIYLIIVRMFKWAWNPKKFFGTMKRDKPPPCLIDDSLGKHFYVKVKIEAKNETETGIQEASSSLVTIADPSGQEPHQSDGSSGHEAPHNNSEGSPNCILRSGSSDSGSPNKNVSLTRITTSSGISQGSNSRSVSYHCVPEDYSDDEQDEQLFRFTQSDTDDETEIINGAGILTDISSENSVRGITINIDRSGNNDQILEGGSGSEKFNFDETLCSCTDTTIGETLLMIMSIGLRHTLPWTALVDICQAINILYNRRIIPDTKYLLQKFFPSHIDKATYHLYCQECREYLGERRPDIQEIECVCGYKLIVNKIDSYFIEFDMAEQLRTLFKNNSLAESLKSRFNREEADDNTLRDIFDGVTYKKYVSSGLLDDWRNISCTFNTDGCKHAKSSKLAVWPIYFRINELPEKMRGKHILMAGLWVDKTEPDMNLFLKPFVDQCNSLTSKGFNWVLNGEKITRYFGCTLCYHPARLVMNTRKYPILDSVPHPRTDESIKKEMIESLTRSNEDEKRGVLKPSVLMNIKNFDLVAGMPPDYMHSCLLGVTRQFTEMTLTGTKGKYYVGSPAKMSLINERLMNIKPPSVIHRKPRSLKEFKLWKATEWRSWLLFYSLPCLEGILPHKYIKHWSLLVSAMEILLKAAITRNELQDAREVLVKFVEKYQKLYGVYEMKYNIHLLLHLSDSVQNWGPLWTQNTFDFENQNRILLQFKHSSRRIATQIANRILSFQNLNVFSESVHVSLRVQSFCQSLHKKQLRWYCRLDDHVLVGNRKSYILTDEEKKCLNMPIKSCDFFSRMIVNRIRYSTKAYCDQYCTKIDDSVVLLHNNQIGMISRILEVQADNKDVNTIILLSQMKLKENSPSLSQVSHINQCELTDRLIACTPKDLNHPCVSIPTEKAHYVATIPRGALMDS